MQIKKNQSNYEMAFYYWVNINSKFIVNYNECDPADKVILQTRKPVRKHPKQALQSFGLMWNIYKQHNYNAINQIN